MKQILACEEITIHCRFYPEKKFASSYSNILQTIYKVYRMSWVRVNITLIVAVMSKRLRRWIGIQFCSVHTGSNPAQSENSIDSGQFYWFWQLFFHSCIGQEYNLKSYFQYCETKNHTETVLHSSLALLIENNIAFFDWKSKRFFIQVMPVWRLK